MYVNKLLTFTNSDFSLAGKSLSSLASKSWKKKTYKFHYKFKHAQFKKK